MKMSGKAVLGKKTMTKKAKKHCPKMTLSLYVSEF